METAMRRVCAWCGTVMSVTEGSKPTTHGLCTSCFDKLAAQALAPGAVEGRRARATRSPEASVE